MKKLFAIFLFIILAFPALAQDVTEWENVKATLEAQEKAWNNGDLEGYMQGYWNSVQLKFVGKNGLTKGWKETLERYKKAYPNQAAMGKLSFEFLSQEALTGEHYLVIGKWQLQKETEVLQGYFTLVLRKIEGKWLIISDHSS